MNKNTRLLNCKMTTYMYLSSPLMHSFCPVYITVLLLSTIIEQYTPNDPEFFTILLIF